MSAKPLPLIISRWLPGWLSSFMLAAIFLRVWISPEWLGWDAMRGLQVLLFVEILTVYGFLLMVTGRDRPGEWLPVLYAALFLGIVLFSTAGAFVAVVLPLHMVARVAGVWQDTRTSKSATRAAFVSVTVLTA